MDGKTILMEQELLSAKVRLTIRRCTRWPTRFCSMILPDRDRRFRFGNTRIPFFMAPYILVCLIFLFILTRIYKTKEYNIAGGKEYFVEEYKKLGKVTLVEKRQRFRFCSCFFLSLPAVGTGWIPCSDSLRPWFICFCQALM